ncbi:MAG: 3-keto-5-aminohexanoate cleavage protein [Rhizobiaceae bacterium]
MVAPNGARRTKQDHPALPVTISEIVDCAKQSREAGAGAIHAHVRDAEGAHVLDAGLYRELIAEMDRRVPEMDVQITTEAVGIYSPDEQRKLVRDVMPKAVSVSIAEMFSNGDTAAAIGFYQWAAAARISVQHIFYSTQEFTRFAELALASEIPGEQHQVLFVLGRYSPNQNSEPADLDPYLAVVDNLAGQLDIDWAVCAFGMRQQQCLVETFRRGGKVRVGFENGLWLLNGLPARDNAALVEDLVRQIAFEATRIVP